MAVDRRGRPVSLSLSYEGRREQIGREGEDWRERKRERRQQRKGRWEEVEKEERKHERGEMSALLLWVNMHLRFSICSIMRRRLRRVKKTQTEGSSRVQYTISTISCSPSLVSTLTMIVTLIMLPRKGGHKRIKQLRQKGSREAQCISNPIMQPFLKLRSRDNRLPYHAETRHNGKRSSYGQRLFLHLDFFSQSGLSIADDSSLPLRLAFVLCEQPSGM